jgi:TRAP-type C4-dicarboxylate transport system permease small subunit
VAETEAESEAETEAEADDEEPPRVRIPRAAVAGGPPHAQPAGVLGLRRIDEWVGKLELVAVSIFLASLIGVAVYQFIASKLLGQNKNWPFEVIRYSVFFVAMSAAALAAQQKKMMAIDFVPRLMKPKTRVISRIIIALVVVFVCYLFIRGGLMVRDSIAKTTEHYDVVNPVTGALALPIGAALIGFHFLIHAVIDMIYLHAKQMPPDDERISVH